ncbi:hypothetical protein QBC35DRAFT_469711 [Podospora australis]|uniref:DUF7726 domain-containing protein n=1 Tax=Podospora australis TaxID=1536484 RepID=A0AAN6X3B0_9PEZI|nr:hypothetical protein QBC35DRAFT_469711 [Podospora australis]
MADFQAQFQPVASAAPGNLSSCPPLQHTSTLVVLLGVRTRRISCPRTASSQGLQPGPGTSPPSYHELAIACPSSRSSSSTGASVSVCASTCRCTTACTAEPTGDQQQEAQVTHDHAALAVSGKAPIDLDDIDLDNYPIDKNCDQVRRLINKLLDGGAMTKTDFAKEIGVSAKSLAGFMGCHGAMKGANFAAYDAAWEWFKKREIAGVPLPSKKQKVTATAAPPTTAASTSGATTTTTAAGKKAAAGASAPAAAAAAAPAVAVDISDVVLEGEDERDEIPVFDSCDEILRKINLYLQKDGVTQAQFCREIYGQLRSPNKPKLFQSVQLQRFRGMKGAYAGCKSLIYYCAYVFFEKIRIKEGKPKSKHRLEQEELWGPRGADRDHEDSRGGRLRESVHLAYQFLLGAPLPSAHLSNPLDFSRSVCSPAPSLEQWKTCPIHQLIVGEAEVLHLEDGDVWGR